MARQPQKSFLQNKTFHVTVGALSGILAIALQVVPQLNLPPAENGLVLGILGAINTYLHTR